MPDITGDSPSGAVSIGLIDDGFGENSRRWRDAVMFLMRRIAELRDIECSPPVHVNIQFFIRGNNLHLDFDGVRTGSFLKADRVLVVQAAVPAEPYSVDESPKVLTKLLWDALDAAEQLGHRRKLFQDSLADARHAIAEAADAPPHAWIANPGVITKASTGRKPYTHP